VLRECSPCTGDGLTRRRERGSFLRPSPPRPSLDSERRVATRYVNVYPLSLSLSLILPAVRFPRAPHARSPKSLFATKAFRSSWAYRRPIDRSMPASVDETNIAEITGNFTNTVRRRPDIRGSLGKSRATPPLVKLRDASARTRLTRRLMKRRGREGWRKEGTNLSRPRQSALIWPSAAKTRAAGPTVNYVFNA